MVGSDLEGQRQTGSAAIAIGHGSATTSNQENEMTALHTLAAWSAFLAALMVQL
jgi:hypothetical protein